MGWGGGKPCLASPAPPKNSSRVPGSTAGHGVWCWHKQHPPRVHRHPTGKPLGDGLLKKQIKEGDSTILVGTYDLKQKQGGNSLYTGFYNVRRGQGPEAAIPGHSHCDLQGCSRGAKQETKACVEKG